MTDTTLSPWERAIMAGEHVRERCRRSTKALQDTGIPYATIGGNAVAEWVGRIDDGAVRNTPEVNLLIRRVDLPAVTAALERIGFARRDPELPTQFFDGPNCGTRSPLNLWFACEKVFPESQFELPDVTESEPGAEFHVASLPALVRMKLSTWRCKDRMHLVDLINVGLVDDSWPTRFPPPLDVRLQQLLNDPSERFGYRKP